MGAQLNVAKARSRRGFEQPRLQAGSDAVMRDHNGNVSRECSGDGLSPPVSDAALLESAAYPALEPTWSTVGNLSKPKGEAQNARPGVSEPKLPNTKEAAESDRGDLSFTRRHIAGLLGLQVAVTVANVQLQRAGR